MVDEVDVGSGDPVESGVRMRGVDAADESDVMVWVKRKEKFQKSCSESSLTETEGKRTTASELNFTRVRVRACGE